MAKEKDLKGVLQEFHWEQQAQPEVRHPDATLSIRRGCWEGMCLEADSQKRRVVTTGQGGSPVQKLQLVEEPVIR